MPGQITPTRDALNGKESTIEHFASSKPRALTGALFLALSTLGKSTISSAQVTDQVDTGSQFFHTSTGLLSHSILIGANGSDSREEGSGLACWSPSPTGEPSLTVSMEDYWSLSVTGHKALCPVTGLFNIPRRLCHPGILGRVPGIRWR